MKPARPQQLHGEQAPLVVGVGGALRPGSSTEAALRCCLSRMEALGARTVLFSGEALAVPFYAPGQMQRSPAAAALVSALRSADALIIASPGYHGGVSGLVKNALDYSEDLRSDPRPYLDGLPIGCIATAAGWQGCVNTLRGLRDIAHALRGWPTPLGVALNTAEPLFADDRCVSRTARQQLDMLADQLASAILPDVEADETLVGSGPSSE